MLLFSGFLFIQPTRVFCLHGSPAWKRWESAFRHNSFCLSVRLFAACFNLVPSAFDSFFFTECEQSNPPPNNSSCPKNGWFSANFNVIQNYTNSWEAWIGNDMAALGSYQRSTWIQCETSLIIATFASTFIVQYRMEVLLLRLYENLHSFGKYLIWKKILAYEVRVHVKSRCRGTRKVIIKFNEKKITKKRVKCHGIHDMNLPYVIWSRVVGSILT